jgi:hypothetical protein
VINPPAGSAAVAGKSVSGATAAPSVVRQTQLLLLQKTAGITGGVKIPAVVFFLTVYPQGKLHKTNVYFN